ncbi:site-specific integrase [Ferribacterium limneticum]|uniref:site-specific integrase n=1 Tax=Ferribacterium limneticum TaxID=76259 RepID=UPI001CFB8AF4|nr:site-specific integrase [Ferribacterium limneticum]UCV20078.1 tyrosine-type recombinase/integrase [Ferribacterium limneticum]
MARQPSRCSNVQNRSPWQVEARNKPQCNQRFPFNRKADAQAYRELLTTQGIKAQLVQLETSFQLRVRRKGARVQVITFDTREQAEQARLKIESELSVSIIRDYASAAQTTLRDVMERYRDEVVPGHKGADVERTRINRLLRTEAFVDKKMAALCTEDLQDFITDRLTEVAPATVDRDLDVISQVIRYAADVWKIAAAESPFVGLRRPKYFNERDRRLLPDEEWRLLEAAQADENPYVEPAIVLALETAARRGELLSIRKCDVFLEERYAYLRDTKNGQPRKVPLTTRAMQVCESLMAECRADDEPLLKLTANALKIAFFRRVVPASGIEDLHFHDLRHEAISRLAESGQFQLIELQAISGHRDTRMLLRYAHLCCGNLAEKMDGVAMERTSKEYFHHGRRRRVDTVTSVVHVQPKTSPVVPVSQSQPSNVIALFGGALARRNP